MANTFVISITRRKISEALKLTQNILTSSKGCLIASLYRERVHRTHCIDPSEICMYGVILAITRLFISLADCIHLDMCCLQSSFKTVGIFIFVIVGVECLRVCRRDDLSADWNNWFDIARWKSTFERKCNHDLVDSACSKSKLDSCVRVVRKDGGYFNKIDSHAAWEMLKNEVVNAVVAAVPILSDDEVRSVNTRPVASKAIRDAVTDCMHLFWYGSSSVFAEMANWRSYIHLSKYFRNNLVSGLGNNPRAHRLLTSQRLRSDIESVGGAAITKIERNLCQEYI